jgi:succinate-semialdehyde dehydrogenase/glutarate-semialdehyde dehydrogenase
MLTLEDPNLLHDRLYLEGQWVGGDLAVNDVRNPATGARVGGARAGGAAEALLAIDAAARALPAWKARPAVERAELLRALHALLVAHRGDLARLLTAEQGKPLAEAETELASSAAYILWFAEEARRAYGDVVPSPWPHRRILVTREAVGVVAAITPWNFPSSMIARKLGAALAAGCTFVLKPAPQTPLSALAWGELCHRAGVPAGVFNCVTGAAEPIGAAMLDSPLVDKLTFTGSTAVGRMLASRAAGSMKRVSTELGGNAPFIVFDDADLDAAVDGLIASKYRNSGQTCISANRVLVQRACHDAFVERLVHRSRALRLGDGSEPGVEQGPLIDAAAVAKAGRLVCEALSEGARLLTGGGVHALGGTFFEPTVLADVTPDMAITREELFGPIAPLITFNSDEEAIAIANDTPHGLAAYFYTGDIGRALRVSEQLRAGMIGVNAGLITTEVAPFGGVGQSGIGREGGRQGLDDYLNTKYLCIGL